jgi:hypothetical protein
MPKNIEILDLVGQPCDWWPSLEKKLVRMLNKGVDATIEGPSRRTKVIRLLSSIIREFYEVLF